MALRRCLEPGCVELTTTTRCPVCARRRASARPNAAQRGYGHDHRKARAALAATLPCPCGYRCGTWLTADQPWHAAHVIDGNPDAGYIASCPSCNQKARRRA